MDRYKRFTLWIYEYVTKEAGPMISIKIIMNKLKELKIVEVIFHGDEDGDE